jgi:uncharacterized protein
VLSTETGGQPELNPVARMLVLQPTPFCNIDCNYSVIWHAGEPLVVPVQYYVRAFEEIRNLTSPKITITHCFQPNGIRIDETWCNFFVPNDIKIGISIDGPQAIHNRNRVTRSGEGTHSQVVARIRRLKQSKIPFPVITVLTAN